MPIERAEEIKPRLGKPDLHWKEGRSAYELATAWMRAKGIPQPVRLVLDLAPEWRNADLLDAIFERETALPGRGLASQTDLLGIVSLNDGNAVLGVEGKVDEPFGSLVGEWLEAALKKTEGEDGEDFKARLERSRKNRRRRLEALCTVLEVESKLVSRLYYQLFHRTCATLYEARQFRYSRAIMLVHSFASPSAPSGMPACFEEFSAFAEAVGMPVTEPGSISSAKQFGLIDLRLGWVSDSPSTTV
jgi:hypothetical protein